MNHCVPEFNMDDEDYSLPSASGLPRQKNVQEDEIMELLWQNGQVVVQSQNPRLLRKSSPPPTKLPHHHPHQTPSQLEAALPPPTSDSTAQLFMHEDEMTSWLQYPLEDPPFDRDLIDLFYHSPMPPSSSAAAALKPPPLPIVHPNHQIPIPSRPEAPPAGLNFPYFSRMTTRFPDSGPSTSSRNNDLRDSTVVDSSDTPAVVQKSKINLPRRNTMEASGLGNRGCNSFSGGTIGGTSTAGGGCMSISMSRDGETCELTLTSSPGGSGASASATATADLMTPPPSVDRKRKGREPVDDATAEFQSEDVEIESYEEKKQARGANTKRSRAAEVHNQSERRRRDRINEKMKALQELIPRCSKTDKASMLDEAIEYLKSLQMQVQMMSMGCGMVPVMFPGVQQYMPSMGMGMGMGMTRHMMPFPAVLSGPGLPAPGAQMNPRFPFQAFPMQQTSNQADASVNPLGMPNLADPYSQQYIGIQHMPMQIPQTQPTSQPGTRQPSTSRGDQDDEKHQTG